MPCRRIAAYFLMITILSQEHGGKRDVEKPLVSVVVLSYNEENYIKEALDSILKQKTNFRFEIICHDDASTDHTQEIIAEYQKKYPDIVIPVLQKENKMQAGHMVIMEYCYPIMRGKYVAYCDGDDYWTDCEKLQREFDFLESHPDYTMCLHNFFFLYKDGAKTLSDCGAVDRDIPVDEFIAWDANTIPQIGTSMFRKDLATNRPDLFIKIGGGKNSKRPISDQPLYIYLAMKGKVKYFSDTMSVWRKHDSGWANSGNDGKELQFRKDKLAFFEALGNQYPDLNRECLTRAKGECMFQIGWYSGDYKTAWRYIQYVKIPSLTKAFIFFGRFFPRLTKHIRKTVKK